MSAETIAIIALVCAMLEGVDVIYRHLAPVLKKSKSEFVTT